MAIDSAGAPTPVRSRWSCLDAQGTPPEPISPELVLVDPELANRVRALAAPVRPAPPREPIAKSAAAPDHRPSDVRTSRLRAAVAAVGVVAAVAVVTIATAAIPRTDERPYLEVSSPPERATTATSITPAAPRSSIERPPPDAVTATTTPKATPAPPASPSKRPKSVELRWRQVPTADYYNVILWSDGTRLRDYWPRRPRIVLVPRELARLGAADTSAIHWFVYPVTVKAGRSLVRSVHASGTFTLPPRTGPTR